MHRALGGPVVRRPRGAGQGARPADTDHLVELGDQIVDFVSGSALSAGISQSACAAFASKASYSARTAILLGPAPERSVG
jgi:hypothetical protein